jgi:hypothetical protein
VKRGTDRPANRSSLRVVAVCSLLAGVGCGEEPPFEGASGLVRDSAGIRMVELSGSPAASTRLLRIDQGWLEEFDLEVGRIGDVAPLPGGGAVMADEMTGAISVLGPRGELRLQFGRLGEGPGEFSPHGGVRWLVTSDSSVMVPDIQLQRITEFSLVGEVLAIHPMPGSAPGSAPGSGSDDAMVIGMDWRAHPRGGMVFRSLHPEGDRILWARGDALETLYTFDLPWPDSNLLLPPTALWDLGPGGELVTAHSDRGRIEMRVPGEVSPSWVTWWEAAAGEVTARDRAHLEELLLTSVEAQGMGRLPPEERDRVLRSVALPVAAPVVASVLVDHTGRTWVQGAAPIQEMGLDALRVGLAMGFGGRVWWVLGRDGLLEEVVTLPRGFHPQRFLEDCMLGTLEGELGVERPARVCLP